MKRKKKWKSQINESNPIKFWRVLILMISIIQFDLFPLVFILNDFRWVPKALNLFAEDNFSRSIIPYAFYPIPTKVYENGSWIHEWCFNIFVLEFFLFIFLKIVQICYSKSIKNNALFWGLPLKEHLYECLDVNICQSDWQWVISISISYALLQIDFNTIFISN